MTLLPSRPCRWRGHTPQGVVKRLEDGLAVFLQDGWHHDTRMERLELAGEVHEHDVCDGGYADITVIVDVGLLMPRSRMIGESQDSLVLSLHTDV